MGQFGRQLGVAFAFAALAVLPSCSDTQLTFTGRPTNAAGPVPAAEKLPVVRVTDLDLGRTFDGYALRVFGETETPGWHGAELRRRGDGVPEDGFIAFDLVAVAPPVGEEASETAAAPPPGTPLSVRQVQAFVLLPITDVGRAAGIRVYALTGPASISFTRADPAG